MTKIMSPNANETVIGLSSHCTFHQMLTIERPIHPITRNVRMKLKLRFDGTD